MVAFNIDFLKSESCEYLSCLTERFFTSSFIPLISRQTRITAQNASLINNLFTNNLDKMDQDLTAIIFNDISDHLPIIHFGNFDNIYKNRS